MIKRRIMAILSVGLLTCGSTGRAAITSLSWEADPGGPLEYSSTPTSSYAGNEGDLGVGLLQTGAPAEMVGSGTMNPGDPVLSIDNSVNNNTGFSWQGY